MSLYLYCLILVVTVAASLYFSTLTYSLRDFSRGKLADFLGLHNGDRWFETLTEQTDQYIFATAVFRMLAGLLMWVSLFAIQASLDIARPIRYGGVIAIAAIVSLFFTIALPLVLARYLAEQFIGYSAPLLNVTRILLSPLAPMMTQLDATARRFLEVPKETEPQEFEQDILLVVEEGEKEGVVDEQERALIENVIEFRDTTAGHIMTPRTDIVALDLEAALDEARATIETSGHSRIPVYEGTLDKIVGILYARDLIKSIPHPDRLAADQTAVFDMRSVIRRAMFVPETKPLRNLLTDFRVQKVHVAIVLDEYGGTSGLVTIEDVLEELVGEIADEHEPREAALFRKTGDLTAEADARLPVAELNAQFHLAVPEDAGYETIGGFLMSAMGRIPEKGAVFEHNGSRFTVLEAEPQRINRVKIELLPRHSEV